MHVARGFVEVEQPGRDFALGLAGLDVRLDRLAVGGVVVLGNLGETNLAAVVHGHRLRGSRCVVGGDLFAVRNEVGLDDLEAVLAGVGSSSWSSPRDR